MTTNYYARWLDKSHFLTNKTKNTFTMFFLLFTLLLGVNMNGQDTFTGDNLGGTITNGTPLDSQADATISGTVGVDFIIDNVTIDITHTFDADLDISLISPSGTALILTEDNGGGGDDYTATIFQDGGSDITAASAPFTGTFEPQGGTFATTFNGESVNGLWILNIVDDAGGDDGVLNDFQITFAPPPSCASPFNLATSNITPDSADLSWDEEIPSSATDGYEVVVMASGDAPDPNNAVVTETVGNGVFSANLSGLAPDTDYDAYVRSVCDAANSEVSDWSNVISLSTLCAPFSAPSWNEDFENAGTIPDCWAQGMNNQKDWEFADTGGFDHIGDDGTIGGNTASDGFFAWLDDSAPHETGTALLSPLIDVSNLTVPQVNFYLLSNNEGNTNVDFSLDVNDGNAWNDDVFFSNSNTANGEWELIEVPLSSLNITGNVIQLRFSVDENNGTDFYDDVAIDDVTVVEAPSCAKPLGLTASNFTADAVDLNWNDEPTASDGYEWVVMNSGDAPDTGNAAATGNVASGVVTANVTGLTDNTSYDAYIRSVCDAANNEVSDWSSLVSFNTTCSPFSAPYSENFDGVTSPAIPDCWNTAGNQASEVETDDSHSGIDDAPSSPNFVKFGDVNLNDGDEAILVSPQFTDLPDHDKQIRFKAAFEDGDANVHQLFVGVMSDPTDASTFVEIDVVTSTVDETFNEFTVSLDDAALVGSNEYVAIAAGSVADFDQLAIDDFFYEQIPSCIKPENLTASNITTDSVDLTWDEESPSTATDGYEWVIMASGDAPDTANAVQTGTVANGTFTTNVTGLTSGADYDAYVRSVCDAASSEVSAWSAVEGFSTLPDFCAGDNFFDNGGPNDDYENGSDEVITVTPDNAGDVVTVEFLSFAVENGWDGLLIHDGPDTSAPLIDSGGTGFQNAPDGAWTGSGTDDNTDPFSAEGETFVSSHPSGALTFRFVSDGFVNEAGWEADVTCGPAPTASVQVIHNSADPAAASVDVYLNGALLPALTGVNFREASAFLTAPAVVDFTVDVVPAGAALSASVFTQTFNLAEDESYIVVADGVLDPSQFDDTVNTIDFGLEVFAGAQQTSTNAGEVSVLVHHGSTDAPTVDVRETSVPAGIIVDDISYTEFQGYLDLATQDYTLDVELGDNSAVVASYEAPLQTLGLADSAITVVASGFLDPALNQNGEAFGLWAALPAGGPLVELPVNTVGTDAFTDSNFNYYPNPVEQRLNISSNGIVEDVQIFNMLGQEVIHVEPNKESPQINMSGLQSGAYMMKISIDGVTNTLRVIKK